MVSSVRTTRRGPRYASIANVFLMGDPVMQVFEVWFESNSLSLSLLSSLPLYTSTSPVPVLLTHPLSKLDG